MRRYYPVLNAFGIILFCFGLMLLPPLALSWLLHDGAEAAYDEALLITAAIGLVLWQSTRHGKGELSNRDAFLLVAMVWT
ncbi:MAG: TrkH family potassium uptake protein, partial [Candidatus Methylophosphatis roskildensis]